MTTLTTGTLQTWAIPVLESEIEKLNKRAARCNCPIITMRVVREFKQVVGKNAIGDDIVHLMAEVEISGDAPRINGWTLVAKLTPLGEGNLVQSAEGVELDEKYRTIEMKCDHCNTNRRRKDVFVIRNEVGEEKVIGRNCLADFLRTNRFEGMIYWADAVGSFVGGFDEFERRHGERREQGTPVESWLRTASVVIRKLGWLGRGAAREQGKEGTASADTVAYLEWEPDFPAGTKDKFCRRHDLYITDFDREQVTKALAWIAANEETGAYHHNLRLACAADRVTSQTAGLVTSLIIAYQKAMELEVKKAEYRKKAADKQWVGEIKKRMRGIELKVLATRSYDSDWGVTTLVRFADADENSIIWWASGDRSEEFEVGETYKVDATVKKHDEHETYGKQTVVNRVTVK